MDKFNDKLKTDAIKRRQKLKEQFVRSGLKVAEFAKKHGISRQRMSVLLKDT